MLADTGVPILFLILVLFHLSWFSLRIFSASVPVIFPHSKLISLTISSEFSESISSLSSILLIFIFLGLDSALYTPKGDFNSAICCLAFLLVLCTSFSILSHSKPEIWFFSELSRSSFSLFLSILSCILCWLCLSRLGILLTHTQKIFEQIRFSSRWWEIKQWSWQTETAAF